jgi:hypothetical protein
MISDRKQLQSWAVENLLVSECRIFNVGCELLFQTFDSSW